MGRKIHFLPPYRYHNMLLLEDLLGIHHSLIKNYSSLRIDQGRGGIAFREGGLRDRAN